MWQLAVLLRHCRADRVSYESQYVLRSDSITAAAHDAEHRGAVGRGARARVRLGRKQCRRLGSVRSAVAGDRIIRLTPGDAATFAIEPRQDRLICARHRDHPAVRWPRDAAAGTHRQLRASRPAIAGIAFAISLFAASVVAPVAPSLTVAAAVAVIAGVLYGATLDRLVGRPRREDAAASASDPGRRRALLWIGSSTLGLAVGGSALGRLLASGEQQDAVLLGGRRRAPLPAPGRDGFRASPACRRRSRPSATTTSSTSTRQAERQAERRRGRLAPADRRADRRADQLQPRRSATTLRRRRAGLGADVHLKPRWRSADRQQRVDRRAVARRAARSRRAA